MAGAVAFVFGLCALSFAAGCVLTVVMLRRSESAEEVPAQIAEPPVAAPVEEQGEQPALRWPTEDFTAKPIHRNPVVGFVGVPSVEPARAPVVLELVPDPEPEPVVERKPVFVSVAELDLAPRPEVVTGRETAVLPMPDREPETVLLPVVELEPETLHLSVSELASEPETVHLRMSDLKPEPEAKPEPVRLTMPEPVHLPTPEPETVAAASPVPAPESELEAFWAPGPVAVPEPAFEPESTMVGVLDSKSEAEPEQVSGANASPVVPPRQTPPAQTNEFRERYLQTFEAARRRSSSH
jgi:hypothetical protein